MRIPRVTPRLAVLLALAWGCASDPGPVGRAAAAALPSTPRCDLAAPIDLARDRPVVASSVAPGSDPAFAVDGEPETTWRSGSDARASLEVDLGEVSDVEAFVLAWGEPLPWRYTLATSTDGRRYATHVRAKVDADTARVDLAVEARFVRVDVWRPHLGRLERGLYDARPGPSIRSFEVLGREQEPPTVPTDLVATAVGADVVELRFTESADETGVVGYLVYRDGLHVGETCCGRFSDHGLAADTSYAYEISALDVFLNESARSTPTTVTTEATPRALLRNGDFEVGGSLPMAWTVGSWIPGVYFLWEDGAGIGGSRAVGLSHPLSLSNDSWWRQNVALVPGGHYNLYGWARGVDIAGGGVGANLAVYGTFEHSWERDSLGTFDWRPFAVTFEADESGLTGLQARLGFFASDVTGTAYFDDLELPADTFASPPPSRHFDISLERDDLGAVSTANLHCWARHLDDAYDAYADLTGDRPLEGERLGILSVQQFPGGLAVAGNPIRWFEPYVAPDLTRVEDEDNWSFAMLHETSHVFDYDGRWVFEAELSANFKMIYVLDRLNARVRAQGVLYEGPAIRDFFRMTYDEAREAGELDWNAITYRFITVVDAIGWLPFRRTYRDFLALSAAELPTTPLEKLELTLDLLSTHAGLDVRALFLPDELAWMADRLGP